MVLLLCFSLLAASNARAGNDDGILLGNDAALMGGAVVAVVSDGSSLWYNPAGLAHARALDTLDVSGSAFVLRSYRIPRMLSATDGNREDASATEVVSVPSALTFVRPLGKRMVAGFGLFAPQSNDFTLRAAIATQGAAGTRWQLAVSQEQVQYEAGGGLAFWLGDRVMMGFSLLGSYTSGSGSLQVSGIAENFDGSLLGFGVQSLIHQSTLLGLELVAGTIIKVTESIRVGVSLRSPGVAVFQSVRVTSAQGGAALNEDGETEAAFDAGDQSDRGGTFTMHAPLRARFGVAFNLPGAVVLDVEGDVQNALRDSDLGIDRAFTWNLRTGARWQFRDHLAFGAGVFTDRGSAKKDASGAGPQHFYGGTVGLQYWNTRKLDASEPQSQLTFSSTVALRYAHGSGKFSGSRIDADTAEVSDVAVPIKVDEFTLHLGSALHF